MESSDSNDSFAWSNRSSLCDIAKKIILQFLEQEDDMEDENVSQQKKKSSDQYSDLDTITKNKKKKSNHTEHFETEEELLFKVDESNLNLQEKCTFIKPIPVKAITKNTKRKRSISNSSGDSHNESESDNKSLKKIKLSNNDSANIKKIKDRGIANHSFTSTEFIDNDSSSDESTSLHPVTEDKSIASSKVSGHIQLEEDEVESSQGESSSQGQSVLLRRFFKQHNTHFKTVSDITEENKMLPSNNEIWVLKLPHDINIKSFIDTKISIDSKSKLKISSQTYKGSLENKDIKMTILKDNSCTIENLDVNGTVNFRKRIPKAHYVEDNIIVNNPTNLETEKEDDMEDENVSQHKNKSSNQYSDLDGITKKKNKKSKHVHFETDEESIKVDESFLNPQEKCTFTKPIPVKAITKDTKRKRSISNSSGDSHNESESDNKSLKKIKLSNNDSANINKIKDRGIANHSFTSKEFTDNDSSSDESTSLQHPVTEDKSIGSSKVSGHIQLEEDEDESSSQGQSVLLRRFFKQHNTHFKTVSDIPEENKMLPSNDEIWVLNLPHDINIKSFIDTKISIDSKSKLKISSQTYKGSLENKDIKMTILKDNSCTIENLDVNGTVNFRKRIPKAHYVEDNIIVNNPTNLETEKEDDMEDENVSQHKKKSSDQSLKKDKLSNNDSANINKIKDRGIANHSFTSRKFIDNDSSSDESTSLQHPCTEDKSIASSKVSGHIQLEEDEVESSQDESSSQGQSVHLMTFFQQHNTHFKTVFDIPEENKMSPSNDEIWVLKLPHDINIKSFIDTKITIDSKSNLKISSQTYKGSLENKDIKMAILKDNSCTIENLDVNGTVNFRKRMPKAHYVEDNIIVNNPTNLETEKEDDMEDENVSQHKKKSSDQSLKKNNLSNNDSANIKKIKDRGIANHSFTSRECIDNDSSSDESTSLQHPCTEDKSIGSSKVSGHIQLEEDEVESSQDESSSQGQSVLLRRFFQQHNTHFKTVFDIPEENKMSPSNDEIWVLKLPHDINIKSFIDTKITIDSKSKLKISSQTYMGSLENKDIKMAILKDNSCTIENLDVNGTMNFRKRMPKAHYVEDNIIVNNPTNLETEKEDDMEDEKASQHKKKSSDQYSDLDTITKKKKSTHVHFETDEESIKFNESCLNLQVIQEKCTYIKPIPVKAITKDTKRKRSMSNSSGDSPNKSLNEKVKRKGNTVKHPDSNLPEVKSDIRKIKDRGMANHSFTSKEFIDNDSSSDESSSDESTSLQHPVTEDKSIASSITDVSLNGVPKTSKMVKERLISGLNSLPPNVTKQSSKISGHNEVETNCSQDESSSQGQSVLLKRFLKQHNTHFKTVFHRPVENKMLPPNDEIWVLKLPHDINIKSLIWTIFSIDSESKLEISSQTYEGSLENKDSKMAILTAKDDKGTIENLNVNGTVNFHKRIPNGHSVKDNILNNQTNFVPLPDTDCRHPLFGSNYEEAIKLSDSVKERLIDKPKKKKKHKEKNHKRDEGDPTPKKEKRVKRNPDPTEAWESAQDIERRLFNF